MLDIFKDYDVGAMGLYKVLVTKESPSPKPPQQISHRKFG